MSSVLRWLGVGFAGVVLVIAAVFVYARFHDGPLAMIAGGPLEAGELRSSRDVAWSQFADVGEIEMQLVEPPRSRTVWVVEFADALYIPCGFLDLPLWKQWPHEALEDGRAILRIDGQRYEVTLVREEDEGVRAEVGERVAKKYMASTPEGDLPDASSVWFFRVDARG